MITEDPIGQTLARLRYGLATILAISAVRGWADDVSLTAIAATISIVGIIVCSTRFEHAAHSEFGPVDASRSAVAIDAVMTVVALQALGIRLGDTLTLVSLLVVVEAGVRLGPWELVVTWISIQLAFMAAALATWNGQSVPLFESVFVAALVLILGLTVAGLTDHLSRRVDDYESALAEMRIGSELLGDVLRTSRRLLSVAPDDTADPSAEETADDTFDAQSNDLLVETATRLTGGVCSIVGSDTPWPPDVAVSCVGSNGRGQTAVDRLGLHQTAVSISNRDERMLWCSTLSAPGPLVLEALELLCAHRRFLQTQRHDLHR